MLDKAFTCITQLGKDTGLSRERLYRSLSGERAPNSDTLF